MPALRRKERDARKFYYGGLRLYPKDALYKEMAFLAYYFHWSSEDVLRLDHQSRRRWCREVSDIHREVNPSKEKKEKSILEMKPTAR